MSSRTNRARAVLVAALLTEARHQRLLESTEMKSLNWRIRCPPQAFAKR